MFQIKRRQATVEKIDKFIKIDKYSYIYYPAFDKSFDQVRAILNSGKT